MPGICVASLHGCWWVLSRDHCPSLGWKHPLKVLSGLGVALAVFYCRRTLGDHASHSCLLIFSHFFLSLLWNLIWIFVYLFPFSVHWSLALFSLKFNECWDIKIPKIRGTCSLQLNRINMSGASSQDVQWHYRKSLNNVSDLGVWRKIIGLAEHTQKGWSLSSLNSLGFLKLDRLKSRCEKNQLQSETQESYSHKQVIILIAIQIHQLR